MKHLLEDLNIQQFNLSSGDSIIGLVKSVEGNMVIVEKPLVISRTVSGGMEAHYFSVYMPLSESTLIKVNYNNIVAVSDVTDLIKEKYIRTCIEDNMDNTNDDDDDELDELDSDEVHEISVIKNSIIYH